LNLVKVVPLVYVLFDKTKGEMTTMIEQLENKMEIETTCIRAIDGDTIEVSIVAEFPDFKVETIRHIRFLGIDTPERNVKGYKEAKDFTQMKCAGKELKLVVTGLDKYGRYLAVIYLPDGTNLNELLLEKKLAKVYEY
jgi:micrococcal nuclease